ncbi:proteoglycan 4-like [Fopius arisanus]|uniref:RNA-directed DNA polymerase n=1 Tax=Fopius arisanus TaxID=64838 RepID=A0A9R1UA72_9HYME|nr:PREDICTED: proteoglycan 4-like [Fopius arisanus]
MVDLDAWKLVLPRELRPQAISQCHDLRQAGHLGVDKTYRRLYEAYYWPNMFRDVVAFVRHCDICQRCKTNIDTPVPRAEDAAPAVDLTESTPPSSPPGQGIKEEPSLLTSQQRAARNAEIALESILFPEGIPVELDDLALPDDSDADVAQDPPPRGPLSPVVVLEKLPLSGRPEAPQSQPAREAPIHLQDYWDPLKPWLPEIRSIEEQHPGFAAALHACTLTPAHHLSAVRFVIPPIPLESVSGTVPLGESEEELPEATSEDHTSERALTPPAHPIVEIGSSSASSSSSSSSSCSSCSSCSSESGNSTIRSPGPAGDPGHPSDKGDQAQASSPEWEDPDSTPAPSIQSAATEFIDLGPLEELSRPSTVPTAESPHPALPHTGTEMAKQHPSLTDSRAGERTPPYPPLTVDEDSEKLPEVTPPVPVRAFAAVASLPSASAQASTSACKQVGPSAPSRAQDITVHTTEEQLKRSTTTTRSNPTTNRGGGQPGKPAGGKRRKPRHWCFDCRRHGHAHQACPTPTGDIFCGLCPHRLRVERVCPEHGPVTQPAGGRTAGYSSTSAETSQVRPSPSPASAASSASGTHAPRSTGLPSKGTQSVQQQLDRSIHSPGRRNAGFVARTNLQKTRGSGSSGSHQPLCPLQWPIPKNMGAPPQAEAAVISPRPAPRHPDRQPWVGERMPVSGPQRQLLEPVGPERPSRPSRASWTRPSATTSGAQKPGTIPVKTAATSLKNQWQHPRDSVAHPRKTEARPEENLPAIHPIAKGGYSGANYPSFFLSSLCDKSHAYLKAPFVQIG